MEEHSAFRLEMRQEIDHRELGVAVIVLSGASKM